MLNVCPARLRSPSLRRALLSALLLTLVLAPAAQAADPIMPLSQVRPGLDCVGLSVIRGTQISQFDVEIIDVMGGQTGPRRTADPGARLGPRRGRHRHRPGLLRLPVPVPRPDGVRRNIGAISETVGEYGNHVVLVTPIEEMLRDSPATRPRAAARAGGGLLRSARPLAGALTVSGLSARTRALLARAAPPRGTAVLAAPAGPLGGFPAQPLVPGASVAAMLSTGDVGLGAVGTVTYRDGARIWAFGHPLDALGQRSAVRGGRLRVQRDRQPAGLPDFGADSYKLTSAGGHTQGTVTTDTLSSISGTLGRPPPAIPLEVVAREPGGGARGHARLAAGRRAPARVRRQPLASRLRSAHHRAWTA